MSDTDRKPAAKVPAPVAKPAGPAAAKAPAPVYVKAAEPKATTPVVAKPPVAAAPAPKPAAAPAPAPAAKSPPAAAPRAANKPAAINKAAPVLKAKPAPKPAPAPVKTAAPVAAPAAKEAIMTDLKTATDKAQAQAKTMFADASERAKASFEKGGKLVEEMNAFSKGNIEAIVESSKIAAKGAEDIARYSADYARQAVEKANATARQFASVKSPTEFFQLQSEVAKSTFDSIAAEGAKFAENYVKLLGEIAQPVQNRFALAAEKVKAAA